MTKVHNGIIFLEITNEIKKCFLDLIVLSYQIKRKENMLDIIKLFVREHPQEIALIAKLIRIYLQREFGNLFNNELINKLIEEIKFLKGEN